MNRFMWDTLCMLRAGGETRLSRFRLFSHLRLALSASKRELRFQDGARAGISINDRRQRRRRTD